MTQKNKDIKEALELILEIRGLEKLLTTYYEGLEDLIYPDSCVRTQFQHVGTGTGRLGSKNPNLQNQPDGNKIIKEHFVSRFQEVCLECQGHGIVNTVFEEGRKGCISCFGDGYIQGQIIQADYCLVPETKVLTKELKWKQIKDVEINEELIGFEENVRTHDGRKFQFSKVINKKQIVKECVKITTEECEVTCSLDHMFLAKKNKTNPTKWIKAEDLKIGDCLPKIMEVWETPETFECGWMSGFLDGEGYINKTGSIGYGQNPGEVFNKANELSRKYIKNTELFIGKTNQFKVEYARPRGLRTGFHMIGVFQPLRLKTNLLKVIENLTVRSKNTRRLEILKIEKVGVKEVIALETSSKTFIAEGFMSHNCSLEVRAEAQLSGDLQYITDIQNSIDFHTKHLALKKRVEYAIAEEKVDSGEWKDERKKVKAFTFGLQYGAGNKTVSKNSGMSEEEVEDLRKERVREYPRLHLYYDWLKTEVEEKGYYTDPFGVRYAFKKYPPRFHWQTEDTYSPTEIQNYRSQGWATGGINLLMLGVFWRKKGLHSRDKYVMVNTVHDSLVLDCRKEYLKEAIQDLKILEDVQNVCNDFDYLLKVNFPVDVQYGQSWAEC